MKELEAIPMRCYQVKLKPGQFLPVRQIPALFETFRQNQNSIGLFYPPTQYGKQTLNVLFAKQSEVYVGFLGEVPLIISPYELPGEPLISAKAIFHYWRKHHSPKDNPLFAQDCKNLCFVTV